MREPVRLTVFPQGELFVRGGELLAVGAYHGQLEALLPHFERVTLCMRVRPFTGWGDRPLDARFGVAPLPPYASRRDLLRLAPAYRRRMLEAAREGDASLVVLPGYLGALASGSLQQRGLPVFHWVVGEWGRVVASRRRSARGRLLGRALRPALDGVVERLTRGTLSFWNGGPPEGGPAPHHYARLSTGVRAEDLRDAGRPWHPGRLVFAGRLSGEKGLPHLLAAAARLAAETPPPQVVLAGEGPEAPRLAQEAARLGVAGRVLLPGWVPRGPALWAWLDAAEAAVLPSLEDMQPRFLLDAMARRVPVIATDVGNVGALVRHEETGLLVPPGSSDALADAVLRLRGDATLREAMVARAAEFVAAHTLEGETERMVAAVRAHFAGGAPG